MKQAKTDFTYVGKSVSRIDSWEKVTGQALFPGDLHRPNMLHMRVLFAGRPHARIVGLDTSEAWAVPGVVSILSAEDVPVNEYGLALNDQPVLCSEIVRFEGDQVAVVIAESEKVATRARGLIRVVYEDLPVVTDPREAKQSTSILIHAEVPDNVLQHKLIRKGDVEKGFAQADVIVSDTYYLPMQEHAYLQPEAGLAYLDGDVVVIETAGQWAQHDQRQIAHALNLPLERVRVIYRAIGGAFGGREDISVQIILALAALKTGRPVKIIWSREESIRGHCKRHQVFFSSRWGATCDGKITAAEVEVVADAGAYAYTSTMVLGHLALTCTGVYDIPNVKVDAYAVYTNNVPAGAFRGFGSPQGTFCAEIQIDKLAEKLGLDAVTFRERNLLQKDSLLSVGTTLPSNLYLERLLHDCAQASGWEKSDGMWKAPNLDLPDAASRKRGIGLALGLKNIGFSFGYPEESTITIELRGEAEIDEVLIGYGAAECGQGTHTAICQIAAEALGLSIEKIRLITTDTSLTPESGSASASRLTLMAGNAVIGAAEEALSLWNDENRPAKATYTYHAPPTTDFDLQTGQGIPNFAYAAAAQAVEVEVDTETGELTISRIITVLDAGRAINPAMIRGQVEGALAQAVGYAVMENYISEGGVSLTPNFSTYLIPTILDIPAISETVILELHEPTGPWGARGVGETALLCVAPALSTALKQATGCWANRLPLTPPEVLAHLAEKNKDDRKI